VGMGVATLSISALQNRRRNDASGPRDDTIKIVSWLPDATEVHRIACRLCAACEEILFNKIENA